MCLCKQRKVKIIKIVTNCHSLLMKFPSFCPVAGSLYRLNDFYAKDHKILECI